MVKFLGLPIQFTIVFVLSLLLFVYLLAASASERVENRNMSDINNTETYAWEDASSNAINVPAATALTSDNVGSLNGGTYYVIVTDANGCTDNDNVSIYEYTAFSISLAKVDFP